LSLIPQWTKDCEAFFESNRWLRPEMLRQYVSNWMSGSQYKDLSEGLGLTVDQVLDLQSGLIPKMKKYLSSFIGLAEMVFEERELMISNAIKSFPDALQFGVPNQIQLDLIDLGFRDRLGYLALGKFLLARGQSISGADLRTYLIANKEAVYVAAT